MEVSAARSRPACRFASIPLEHANQLVTCKVRSLCARRTRRRLPQLGGHSALNRSDPFPLLGPMVGHSQRSVVENHATSSAALRTPMVFINLARWASTVRFESSSSSAISELVLPCDTKVTI